MPATTISKVTKTLLKALLALPLVGVAANWQPVAGKMTTRWAKDVSPKNSWSEYPRPGFERKDWKNLNSLWDYAITTKDAVTPTNWNGIILGPFCVEATLSGIDRDFIPL